MTINIWKYIPHKHFWVRKKITPMHIESTMCSKCGEYSRFSIKKSMEMNNQKKCDHNWKLGDKCLQCKRYVIKLK